MSDLQIRLMQAEDTHAVASLICALETHYNGVGNAPSVESARAMVERSVREREGTRYAIAWIGGRPVGLACFAVLRPGRDLAGLVFLKELFVEDFARGQAVGEALMAWLAAHARAQGIGRIDLTTDAGNRGARSFYERLGGQRKDKVFYRFDLGTGVLSVD
jgi:GNAT superfamily N-acetyltransferase